MMALGDLRRDDDDDGDAEADEDEDEERCGFGGGLGRAPIRRLLLATVHTKDAPKDINQTPNVNDTTHANDQFWLG